ncbi:MAG TPA: glycosyltransferase [Terriglobales bacterium]|nr:glycosyltransferase [Terriglobales bacterium]
MSKPIFYDPQRKRWRRLRRVIDVAVLGLTLLAVFFVVTVLRGAKLPDLLLPEQKRLYHALKEKERRHTKVLPASRRKSKTPPSQVVLNNGDGIRAAYYVTWDAGSFASLKEYVHQIDLLYPEWIHAITPDGRIQSITQENKLFDIVQDSTIKPVDDKVMPLLKFEKAETEVLPMVNNFDPTRNLWISDISAMLNNPAARTRFRTELLAFLASDKFRGINLDFESFPLSAQPGYKALVAELYSDLHSRSLKLHISVPVRDKDFDYAYLAAHSDGLVLMNYDEHYSGGDPGPIASQEWFTENLIEALKVIPREKIICAIGNYGYDWAQPAKKSRNKIPEATSISAQEAWLSAHDSESTIDFDSDFLNPHYAYTDDNNTRHDVWFLDGVTAFNQMRAALSMGIQTFALWRLGSEDRSMWAIWDLPYAPNAQDKLNTLLPGQDVDMEGNGEILRIATRPASGLRTITMNPKTGLISDQEIETFATPYTIDQYGAAPRKIAITFDDGPDPEFTPKILDVLKQKNVRATFFMIGMQAEQFPGIVDRTYREGHELGNHTWTHPDISNISKRYIQLEMNLTELFFASRLGVKPMLFRPPYSIDQEPDTADQVRPLEIVQGMGYITVGDKLDPNDWKENPHRSADQIVKDVLDHLPPCRPADLRCGNILLLHDGGGNRTETVKALPRIIDGLRARGYEPVPVSELLGKTRDEVMPPIAANERWSARGARLGFMLFGLFMTTVVVVFYIGDILMSARLLFVGGFAIYDRFRTSRRDSRLAKIDFQPPVAVLIPAYNEEKVIERTVRAVLMSHYPHLRAIVVDDGSKDNTLQVVRDYFQAEIATGKVLVLSKPNSGKADALNYGLEFVTEEIFIGIDADTVIARDAITRLVTHFLDARIGAVAGNAKVGNRVNLWTRWQALEYITSQNFERRALNTLGAVSVVPGAIGAWRTSAVKEAGGYPRDTVAEDGDLTMALLENGYRVIYEDRAIAWTEAPSSARGLMRQRFRWSFGILQAVWKHRAAFGRKGVLGWVALPNIVIFQILLPVVSPFIDLMFVSGLIAYGLNKYFHPETANPANLEKLVAFFVTFLVVDFIASVIAFALERREPNAKEDVWLLAHVWLQRFAYRQLFSVVLVKTLKRAVEGRAFAWDKLERTAALPYAKVGT